MNRKQKRTLWRILWAAVLFGAGLLARLLGQQLLFFLLAFCSYGLVGYDVLFKAVRGIFAGQWLDENFLMALASVGAVCTGDASEAAAVMLFYQVGELFQNIAVGKSRGSISALLEMMPDTANVLRNGDYTEVDPSEVAVGETILVRPGEKIPLDGTVLGGSSSLNTAALTGESLPRDVAPGDPVLSGCVNLHEAITLRVEKPFENSTVSRILTLVEDSTAHKSRSEQFITKFARYYTPIVVLGALLVAVLPPLLIGAGSLAVWKQWIHMAIVFLVISCPCALVISIPMAFFGGIGGASAKGILVKGSEYLETLSRCRTVVFDKTGTLTEGSFRLQGCFPAPGKTEAQLLEAAAYAEARSDHPIACSILAANGALPHPEWIGSARVIPGKGVCTVLCHPSGSITLLAGNAAFLRENGILVSAITDIGTVVYVALQKDGQSEYLGALLIGDTLKSDAAEAITALHRAGVTQTVMLTGDRTAVAEAVGNALGLDAVRAELLPEGKLQELQQLMGTKKLSERGSLVFVGDGINDAPVLATADVGIAMGALGSDAAIEAADIVIADDRPSKIATAIRIAKKTVSIARQNIVLALSVKAAILLLDLLTVLPAFATLVPYMAWLAVFADVGVAMLAILNAMRAMKCNDTKAGKETP